jgi:FAD/FMN-containing dehydrogenase
VLQSSTLIRDLRAAVAGRVVTPGDPGYDDLRVVFPGGVDRRPSIIVLPKNDADVRHTVTRVRNAGGELAVRSGGHTIHCTTEGGVVLDLREMSALAVDVVTDTAWAQTGLTAAAYSTAVGAYGLATGFGDTGSVGIGGITLGGGIGYLTRKHGLTIDSVLAAEIVTADGELRRVDSTSEPDLFWAIRGGGGNFGVATRFQYRLRPVDRIVGGMLLLPATPEVVAGFVAAAEAAPDELTTIANVMPAPPMPFIAAEHHGKIVVLALMCFAGDAAAGEQVLKPFRELAAPVADMVKPMAYHEIFPPDDSSYHPTAVGKTMFIDRVDHGCARTIVDVIAASDAAMRVVQIRVLGGAMARVAPDATAFAHRQARILINVAAFVNDEAERSVRQSWVDDVSARLDQGVPGAYVNFLNNEGPDRVRAAYPGSTGDRLRAIKARYDPDNFFRRNENITGRKA